MAVAPSDTGKPAAPEEKKIPFQPLSTEQQKALEEVLSNLENLKKDIEEKQATIAQKSATLTDSLKSLEAAKTITLQDGALEMFAKTQKQYEAFSMVFLQEVSGYLGHYASYLSENHPKEVSVTYNANVTFDEHINASVSFLRRLIKKRTRELNVLFSKYDYRLQVHLEQLKHVATHQT